MHWQSQHRHIVWYLFLILKRKRKSKIRKKRIKKMLEPLKQKTNINIWWKKKESSKGKLWWSFEKKTSRTIQRLNHDIKKMSNSRDLFCLMVLWVWFRLKVAWYIYFLLSYPSILNSQKKFYYIFIKAASTTPDQCLQKQLDICCVRGSKSTVACILYIRSGSS